MAVKTKNERLKLHDPPSTAWRDNVSAALDCLNAPRDFLTAPQRDEVSVADLLSVRQLISPERPTQSQGALLVALQLGLQRLDMSPLRTEAARFAASVAGESRREPFVELVKELIKNLDSNIAAQLDSGTTDERLLRVADLPSESVIPLYVGEAGGYYTSVILPLLPDDHALQGWSYSDKCCEVDRGNAVVAAVVLGPRDGSGPGIGRKWYSWRTVEECTRRVRHARGLHVTPQRPNQPTPLPTRPKPQQEWVHKLTRCLEVYKHPDKYLVSPPDDTPLDDLLSVREKLGVRDSEHDHAVGAALRLAAKVAGREREADITDILRDVLAAVDGESQRQITRGLNWCSEQARLAARD